MAESSGFEKERKRSTVRRDSRPAARAHRDVLRKFRSADKRRTKARRSSKS
jgi:hypothetical protein